MMAIERNQCSPSVVSGGLEQHGITSGLSVPCSRCGNAGKQWTAEVFRWSYW